MYNYNNCDYYLVNVLNTLSAVRPIVGLKKFETNCFPVVMYDSQGDVLLL